MTDQPHDSEHPENQNFANCWAGLSEHAKNFGARAAAAQKEIDQVLNKHFGDHWFPCCDHCGCGEPGGHWPERMGHDDTCSHGCNDAELTRSRRV